jgi:hypothetical protein
MKKRGRSGEPGEAGFANNKKNTNEASMLLKKQERMCETN